MNITLRQSKPEDLDWLDEFYESLMRPYVELTHAWDEKKFRKNYNVCKFHLQESVLTHLLK